MGAWPASRCASPPDIAAVTRDKDGSVVAGSLDDAVESLDIWTFSRDVSSAAPDWVLDETDEG
jgi:predicted lipid-binding transport protein (Tim44 family)